MAAKSLEEQGEASSIYSRPRNEALRSHEDQPDRTTPLSSPEIHASSQTFKFWEDSIEDWEVEDFVYEQPPTLRSQPFKPGDADCGDWSSPSGPKCPSSFGENGVTATAGAFGQIVQLSAYLGAGNSGMFAAGHSYTEWPYLIPERARDLLSLASKLFEEAQGETRRGLFGLKFLNLKPSLLGCPPPRLTWFQYRWPRYEYDKNYFRGIENVQLTIQFMVRDKTVFQQCILENRGETDITLELAFGKGINICDLDHVTDDYEFNRTTSNQQNAGPGPGGFGWVHVNRFHEESSGTRTHSQQPRREEISDRRLFNHNTDDSAFGVAFLTSMAVDGKMMRFCPGRSPHIWKETLKATSALEIVTAYKLVLLPNPSESWKKFVVPLREMNMNHFLREAKAVLLFRRPITRMSRKDGLDTERDKRDSESMKRDDKSETGGDNLKVSQERMATMESQPQNESLPGGEHESTKEKTSPVMERIEFTVRRNLQHILDVCAIPVAVHVSWQDPGDSVWQDGELRDVQAIALSCGDLSGHRLCTTSSFFAFQFLAEVAERLGRMSHPDRDDEQVQALISRIKEVCVGHLKWLYFAEKNDQEQAFGPLYWVSGEAVILPESSQSWTPTEHPRDTAFQILKAMIFGKAFANSEDVYAPLVSQLIRQWGWVWVRWLQRMDRRESLTWWHKEDHGLKFFRLDDQVWIWRALRAVENEDDGVRHRDRGISADPEAFDALENARTTRRFASWTIRRETLLKFTTHHEIMRKKMIALARSPRETRFLFHARDTAVLYGEDMGFFPEDAEFRQAWKNTIDVQRLHENNQEARWDNALRYALSIMLGTRGHQINNKKPEDMVREATMVLMRSSSENGLFPGKLEILAKSPLDGVFSREQDADSYYGASFEIPYIFLTHAEAIEDVFLFDRGPKVNEAPGNERFSRRPTIQSPNSPEAMATHRTSDPQVQLNQIEDRDLAELVKEFSNVLKMVPGIIKSTSSSDYASKIGEEMSGVDRLTLKKAMPFSYAVDSHNVVDIEDEWLFNYPDFFGFERDDCISMDDTFESMENSDATWLKRIDVARMRRKYGSQDNEDGEAGNSAADSASASSFVGSSSASSHSKSSLFSDSAIVPGGPGDTGLWVVDFISRKHLPRKGIRDYHERILGPFEDIWKHLRQPRTVANAKKRMILWERPDTNLELEAALLCYSASKGNEKADMLEFFERHFRHENFLFDHCNLAYNIWETEIHLSFFMLGDASGPFSSHAPLNLERFPGLHGKHISRGSMGARFHGDAFDRYWTLHLFYNVNPEGLADRGKTFTPALDKLDKDVRPSVIQRKVFELHIIAEMLSYVESGTLMILSEVKSEMGIKSGAFSWSIPSMDTYSSWHRIWEGFAPLLQALADDLVSAQDIIAQWETREDGRGQERPRWTRNDEKKYRASITRAQQLLDWQKKKIRDALTDVKSLEEACTARLANAREELAFRSSQNIASFTYVTIVFLPLGFAASVFSMNGYPDGGWVASMAVIAVVTLAITAVALANAKLLLGVAEQVSKDARGFTGAVFRSSLIGEQQQRRRDERVQDSPGLNEPPSAGDPKAARGEPLDGRTIRHVLFWMAYLLIELPARRVALACRELPASLKQNLGSPGRDARPAGTVGSTDGHSMVSLSVSVSAASIARKSVRIVGGILLLPLLFVSWTIQLLFYNILDVLVFLGRLIKRTFYGLVTFGNQNRPATNTKILQWLIDPPSSLRPMRNIMSREKMGQESAAQSAASLAVYVGSDRSDPGPRQEV